MISMISTTRSLSTKRDFIDHLFFRFGEIYLQEYRSLLADFYRKRPDTYKVFINDEFKFVTAFEKKTKKTWQCTILGYPLLCPNQVKKSNLILFFNEVKKELKATTIYFPLVYRKCKIYKLLKDITQPNCWNRLPSPIIEGELSSKYIWNRVLDRYGSRADRQKKKFENNLLIKSVDRKSVEKIIKKIELNSWKRPYFQDMLSRGNQFIYYTKIIKSGLADVTVAFNKDGEPVAYRIDSEINGVYYVIKWSYDENYRQYSPGFYLLTIDLFRRTSKTNIKYVDLYGSPDLLKNLLETNRLERFDFCYSTDLREVKNIKDERVAFDYKIADNYKKQQSIKKIFNNLQTNNG